jgi:hypothetical protein
MLPLGLALLGLGIVVYLVGAIWLAVAAFRVRLMWGFLVLLVPFAFIAFLVHYWNEGKRPFFVGLGGLATAGLAGFMVSVAFAAKAKSMIEASAQEFAASGFEASVTAPHRAAPPAAAPPVDSAENPSASEADAAPVAAATAADPTALEPVPAAVNDYQDPAVVNLADLPKHIGADLLFDEVGGTSVRGKLVAVETDALVIERSFTAGSIRYDLPRTSLKGVRKP